MSIVYLFAAYPLWSETFIRQDLSFLEKTGIPCRGAALFHGDCAPRPDWPSVTVLANSHPEAPASAAVHKKRPAMFIDTIRRCLPRKFSNRLSLFRHRNLTNALADFCRKEGTTHIHAEFADLAAIIGADVARKNGLSFSMGIHAFDVYASHYDLHPVFRQAQFITVCNRAAMENCIRRFPESADKLHLIYHGVNLHNWTFNTERHGNGKPVILFVGRLVQKKGIHILLRSMRMLLEQIPDATLKIIGSGNCEDELRRLASEIGVEHAIQWLGYRPQEEIRSIMTSASCLCAPSIVTENGDRDGIPNVILEAMAAGLPVVASLAGSISEAITDQTGWPIQSLSPETLADTLTDVLSGLKNDHSDTLTRRITAARTLIEHSFNAAALAEKRAQLFSKYLNHLSSQAVQ